MEVHEKMEARSGHLKALDRVPLRTLCAMSAALYCLDSTIDVAQIILSWHCPPNTFISSTECSP